jgi:glyoxylase-like metal-dependent hydrolase (beta-lactamase superfamily II)
VIVERSMHPQWLSNSYVVADEPGGHGIVIDSGAPSAPLIDAIDRLELSVPYLLLTHHHGDHVAENHVYKERLGVEILAHPLEAEHLVDVDRAIEPGEVLRAGSLRIDGLHTPGHTAGMLSFRVGDEAVFTGDTLFRSSVGGVRAPGSTTFEDLRGSIMDVLMRLPPETVVYPGHTDPTTVAEEWESNPFIRLWRGLDGEGDERCTVRGEPARLVLWGPDYDGGHKAWVRWEETERDDIVPGSVVERGQRAEGRGQT